MTAFDIFTIVVAAIAFISGFFTGIIRQVGTLAGFVVGIIACRLFGADVEAWLSSSVQGSGSATSVIAYAGLFLVAFFAVKILANAVRGLIGILHLSVLDRICGAAFRAAVWMFVLSLCFNLWAYAAPAEAPSGTLTDRVEQIAPWLLGVAASKAAVVKNQISEPDVKE